MPIKTKPGTETAQKTTKKEVDYQKTKSIVQQGGKVEKKEGS